MTGIGILTDSQSSIFFDGRSQLQTSWRLRIFNLHPPHSKPTALNPMRNIRRTLAVTYALAHSPPGAGTLLLFPAHYSAVGIRQAETLGNASRNFTLQSRLLRDNSARPGCIFNARGRRTSPAPRKSAPLDLQLPQWAFLSPSCPRKLCDSAQDPSSAFKLRQPRPRGRYEEHASNARARRSARGIKKSGNLKLAGCALWRD
ncbi:hypothetical protein B0H19DRAFT_166151 [Mycena capillaripes]|nr:hypothetical protein B0H19DRAFT_166151 [Mycena capillaripes]